MFRIIMVTLIVAFAVTATAASAQWVKAYKYGGVHGSKVMAPAPAIKQLRFKMHPGPTTYKFKPMPGPTTY